MSTQHINALAPAAMTAQRQQLDWRSAGPGLLLCAVLASLALWLAQIPWFAAHGLSALTLAILLGLALGNSAYPALETSCAVGVQWARGPWLRCGVMLYGLRLTLQDIGHVGLSGVAIDATMLLSTFGLGCWLGIRWLKLDRETATLIAAGSAICGAAAVLATAPVVRGKAGQVSVAVATVVLFGTLAILLYPCLYALNLHWHVIKGGASGFGIYAGSTIHEVAQVVAAARSISPQAADSAVIAKMVRVMLLAPFLLTLALWRGRRPQADARPATLAVPWFAFGFIGVVLFNSLHLLPQTWQAHCNDLDTLILATAMAALGLGTRFDALRVAGLRPLVLGALLFAWLVLGGALVNALLGH